MKSRVLLLHLAVAGLVLGLGLILPDYHQNAMAKVLVLALYATGYNLAFGYTGLLSLGHALFFGAGLYAAGLPVHHLGWGGVPALAAGLVAGAAMAGAVGALALRTRGVSFMIVTLMFAQAGYLVTLYFNQVTGGDQGLVLQPEGRLILGWSMGEGVPRFVTAWAGWTGGMLACLWVVRSAFGRVLVGLRENEERSRMLGHDPYGSKLGLMVLSGAYSGLAGALFALLFGYVGSSLVTVQYSILPMLYVLLGGAGTVLGPLIGAAAMFYLVDFASGQTNAYLMVVGVALILLVLVAPRGLLGILRERVWSWLP